MPDIRRFIGWIKGINCGDADADSLSYAAMNGDLAEVRRLVVDCGVDPNIQDNSGWTPLHRAAFDGRLEIVKFLLEHGADPNIQDNYHGNTPLHDAAVNGHLEVVKLLLEHGADPNIQNNYGDTPLHRAAFEGHCVVVKFLLDHGADPTIRNNKGRTPLELGRKCREFREMLRRRSGGTTVYE